MTLRQLFKDFKGASQQDYPTSTEMCNTWEKSYLLLFLAIASPGE
jgi:hypothetical protein